MFSNITRRVLTHGVKGEREARRGRYGEEGGECGKSSALSMFIMMQHVVASLGIVTSHPAAIPLPPPRHRPRRPQNAFRVTAAADPASIPKGVFGPPPPLLSADEK